MYQLMTEYCKTQVGILQDFNRETDHGIIPQECTNKGRALFNLIKI